MRRLLLILFFLGVNGAYALNASGGGYTVMQFTSGVQGGNASGSGYEADFLLTSNTGGSASGGGYRAVTGFFGALGAETAPETVTASSSSGRRSVAPSASPAGSSGRQTLTLLTSHTFSHGDAEYTVYLDGIDEEMITLTFSEGGTITLGDGGTAAVDLDGDGVPDIAVSAWSAGASAVEIELSVLQEKENVPQEDVPPEAVRIAPGEEPESPRPIIADSRSRSLKTALLLIVIGTVVFGGLFFLRKL